jgi:hypothetical protein
MAKGNASIMPVTFRWYDAAETILYVLYEDDWTIQNFFESIQTATQLIQTKPQARHDMIVHLKTSPRASIPVFHADRATGRDQDTLGIIVLVTEKRFDQVMAQVLTKVNSRYRRADSVKAAVALIQAARGQAPQPEA